MGARALPKPDISRLLARLYPIVREQATTLAAPYPGIVLFLSVSDGRARAHVISGAGRDFDTVWRRCAEDVRRHAQVSGVEKLWLRVDWVEAVEAIDWRTLRARLSTTKRNYFRQGIALDPHFGHAFLETEINANAMLYGGPKIVHCVINEAHFRRYAARRHGLDHLNFADDTPLWIFSACGVFATSGSDEVHLLGGIGLDTGRRVIASLATGDALGLIERSSAYLAAQLGETGRFRYGWHPCFARSIEAYNALRHASSLYAMIEAWELTRDPVTRAAIDRGIAYLTETLIVRVKGADGERLAFLVDQQGEIKLGGNAVCLLALVKYSELTGTDTWRSLLDQLAAGILSMQDTETGRFDHVLQYPSLAVKDRFRIIYYDGEAAFGLMRLHAFTRDARWLHAVERAFGWFIRNDHWKAHDHWLSYAVNELTRWRPEKRYYQFGIRNFADYLDFVIERITTFPTLLELMMAARQMLARIADHPDREELLAGVDLAKFHHALHTRAHYLLNGHFWPELAMFFARPDDIAGSFFIRHHAFRVRIDDVAHYLSGFVAYWKYLADGSPAWRPCHLPVLPNPARSTSVAGDWSADEVLAATRGYWLTPPPHGWRATGVSTQETAFRPDDMVVVRSQGARGIPPARLSRLPGPPRALISDAADGVLPARQPLLRVADVDAAILDLGAFARARFTGKVIGITGSAGKTTVVAMLGHVLRPWGEVGQTRNSANLPHGIAWNLASMPRDAPYVVLEMAIGRMREGTRLARPDVALVTNVAPAHLEYHRNIEEVARRKARIFEGMVPDALAIINRDSPHWEIFADAAGRRALRTIFYGQHADADGRLIRYDPASRTVTASIAGCAVHFAVGAPGAHMALNAIGCLTVLHGLGLPIETALPLFGRFRAPGGRGAIFDLRLGNRRLRMIDEAYNANPASMAAAIGLIREIDPPLADGRRVLALGDMLELGPGSPGYHAALADAVMAVAPDMLLLCGPEMRALAGALPIDLPRHWSPDVADLIGKADGLLADGDLLLVKGSAGTGLSRLVRALKSV